MDADFEVDFDADFEVDLDGDSRLTLTLISRLIRSRGFGGGLDLDGGFGWWIWMLISRLIRSRFELGWFGVDF